MSSRKQDPNSLNAQAQLLWETCKDGSLQEVRDLALSRSEDGVLDAFLLTWRHPRKHTTALMQAAHKGHDEVVVYLLANKADLSLQDFAKTGHTALHYACLKQHTTSTVRMLLDTYQVNVHCLNSKGQSPFDLARFAKHDQTAKLFRDHLKLHSGWLYVKRSRFPFLPWQKYYCEVYRNLHTPSELEISFYKCNKSICPSYVLLYDPSMMEIEVDYTKIHAFDQDLAFSLSKHKVFMQEYKEKVFSRAIRLEEVDPSLLRKVYISLDDQEAFQRWINIFTVPGFSSSSSVSQVYAAPISVSSEHDIRKAADIHTHQEEHFARRLSDASSCVVCSSELKSVICVPCGHLSLCIGCSVLERDQNKNCPVCQAVVEQYVKVEA